jgi:cobalt transporter subunit CbtA
MIQKLVVSALFAGAVAGLIAGLLQLVFVQPVLLHAELYEQGTLVHFGAEAIGAHPDLPGFDAVRDGLSIVFTMLTYTGYAMLLLAAMVLGQEKGAGITARWGALWGVAGFIVFQLAPAFSLPPEVPGVAAADVTARQIWWFGTAGATAVAMWLLAFGTGWVFWGIGAVLLFMPHIVGAPEPATFAGTVPPELAALFASRALGVGLAAWVLLGLCTGWFWQKETENG